MLNFCEEKFIHESKTPDVSVLTILDILRGRKGFGRDTKDLYDRGICYFDRRSNIIRPVNRCAEIALQRAFSKSAKGLLPSMTSAVLSDSYLGAVFEAHVLLAVQIKQERDVKIYSLCARGDSVIPRSVEFGAGQLKFFKMPAIPENYTALSSEICIDSHASVVWVCNDDNYVCDGIIVPPAKKPLNPVIIYDTSITFPYDRESKKLIRLQRLQKTLSASDAFQGREVIVVLCYHKKSASPWINTKKSYAGFYDTLDKDGLLTIGVPF